MHKNGQDFLDSLYFRRYAPDGNASMEYSRQGHDIKKQIEGI